MPKDYEIRMNDLQSEYVDAPILPEVLLWLAVIDRAIADYCSPAKELPDFFKIDLYNFFFEDSPRPYNLVYICSMLLDREDAVAKIRKRIPNYSPEEKNRSYRSSSF
jgi:hypothetical protein